MGSEENYQKLYKLVEAPIRIKQERIRREHEEQTAKEQKRERNTIFILILGAWIILPLYKLPLSGNWFNEYLMGCFLISCTWMFVLYWSYKSNKELLAARLKMEERELEKLERLRVEGMPAYGSHAIEIQCPKGTNQMCYYQITVDFRLVEKKYCAMCNFQDKQ